MPKDFTSINHYFPQWYQKLFVEPGQTQYHYLDLKPEKVVHPDGSFHFRTARRRLGPERCFNVEHLYTTFFGGSPSDEMERRFFGGIDDNGARAVQFFHSYDRYSRNTRRSIDDLMKFASAQKLRTPKGIDYIKGLGRNLNHDHELMAMGRMHQIHITMWMECVWEVLECDDSPTKLIVSDHPVTVYNKGMFPLSVHCTCPNDPSIGHPGTHTLMPLGMNRLLVLTNLGYVRNPWAIPTKVRENARSFQTTVFDIRRVQTGRQMSEKDVIAVNFIIKQRARRYIAAAQENWLYPEKRLKSTMWDKLGDRFFLMPDARKVRFTTQVVFGGYKDGSSWGMDEYGRNEGDTARVEALRKAEWDTFHKHRKVWEDKFGDLTTDELRALDR